MSTETEVLTKYPLNNNWTYYLHLHDTREWNIESYNKILSFTSLEYAILLNDQIHYDLIKKSMMFLMKENIFPMWEDEQNKTGGCFSFKVANKEIKNVWKHVFFSVLGGTITKNKLWIGLSHIKETKSERAKIILDEFDRYEPSFWLVSPAALNIQDLLKATTANAA